MNKSRTKRKIQLTSLLISVLLVVGIISTFATPQTYAATRKYKTLDVNVTTTALNSIQLSWKSKKNVVKWKVQIGKQYGKFHTVTTLKKNRTSYTFKNLQNNTDYYFQVIGYAKKKGKQVIAYKTDKDRMSGRTGIETPDWFYEDHDSYVSPTEIFLLYGVYDGLIPDGYEIYRKDADTSGSEYEKITTVKHTGNVASYQYYYDKTVKGGKHYLYRIRAYKSIDGRNIYTGFSRSISFNAVNENGTYSLKKISLSKKNRTLVVKLTSDLEYNGVMNLKSSYSYIGFYPIRKDSGADYATNLKFISYSTDGIAWTDANSNNADISLKGGQSIYLKLKADKTQDIYGITGLSISMAYDGDDCAVKITFGGSGVTYSNY